MDYKEYEELLLISLCRINFLNLAEKIILLKNIDTAVDLALLSIEEINQITGRNIRARWDGRKNLLSAQRELKIIKNMGIKYLLYNDSRFPALLREINDAPFLIFYRGNPEALSGPAVSVVGTRRITIEGRRAAFDFSRKAAGCGVTVVSGLAYGTDAISHQGAVEGIFDCRKSEKAGNGFTCAVLPSGCDTIVPDGNKKLAAEILETGGIIISEYVPGVPSEPWRYVQRNRIIAGLSPATVVIQAPAGSGALITADYAVSYNRDLMFHEACFSAKARIISEMVQKKLEAGKLRGMVSDYKIGNTVEKYISSGAPVIKDFEDYCRCREEIPGIRSERIVQLNLFEGI